MHTTTVNGTAFEYEVTGTGEPVLLIPTGPIADGFLPFMAAPNLGRGYHLVRYRQRGQVDGHKYEGPVSFAQHAADAAALLASLDVPRAHIVGHSTGAAIALELAANSPGLVHSITLLEPPLLTSVQAEPFFERARPAVEAYAAGDHERAMAEFLAVVSGLRWEICRQVLEQAVPGSVARATGNAGNFFESVLPALNEWVFDSERAAMICQPVLSVVGTETEPLFLDGHELLRKWLPACEDAKIRSAGHLLHMQCPEPVTEAVATFLGRHAIAVD